MLSGNKMRKEFQKFRCGRSIMINSFGKQKIKPTLYNCPTNLLIEN